MKAFVANTCFLNKQNHGFTQDIQGQTQRQARRKKDTHMHIEPNTKVDEDRHKEYIHRVKQTGMVVHRQIKTKNTQSQA